ncbi:MAG: hypothetical protein OXH12_10870, partial [Chloroflexi bacterium]|nr:hypothetical protein [Chloroflexota bacterium]
FRSSRIHPRGSKRSDTARLPFLTAPVKSLFRSSVVSTLSVDTPFPLLLWVMLPKFGLFELTAR